MPPLLYSLPLAIILIAAAVFVHFEALRVLSTWHEAWRRSGHVKVLFVIFGLITAHIVEAALFAVGFWIGERILHLGSFVGSRSMTAADFFYFSVEAFTTQGVGDIYPIGALRLIGSLEPLIGLILIGWSASFTFLLMARNWQLTTQGAFQDGAAPQSDTD